MIERLVHWSRVKSPWVLHLNAGGGCNGCDIEILASLMPRFDLERFGVQLKGTPRHADVMICTGAVTLQNRDRVLRIYEQVPDPKFVVAAGACAMAGCVYRGSYHTLIGIDQLLPVNAYVPGCPFRPAALIDAVVKLLNSVK
jgi:NADH-quinone oxidoreductase B subunit